MKLGDFGAEKEWPFCVELRGCGTEGTHFKPFIMYLRKKAIFKKEFMKRRENTNFFIEKS